MNDESSHVERIVKYATSSTVAVGEEGPPDIILQSWRRCLDNLGLEPHRISATNVMTPGELAEVRDRVSDLSSLAKGEMERLFRRVRAGGYLLQLTDPDGVVVDFRCNDDVRDQAIAARIIPGSIWSEDQQGTNGIGTCAKTRQELSIVMNDHFSSNNIGLTCSVAPIFGSQDNLVGILNLTNLGQTTYAVQSIMREMISSASRRIENLYFSRRNEDGIVVRISPYDDFSDAANEVQIAFTASGCIKEIGGGASKLLAQGDKLSIGRRFEDTFRLPFDALLSSGKASCDSGSSSPRKLHLRLELPRPVRAAGLQASERGEARPAAAFRKSEPSVPDFSDIVGDDTAALRSVSICQRLHEHAVPILLLGETGAGKSVLARALHRNGSRRDRPFVTINCASIPTELIESELFGYRPGAFTGALAQGYKGKLLEADGGTLFLDEVGDMPLPQQTRLLQVLSDGEFTPVGGGGSVRVDIAVISATLQDLERLVEERAFREDLYFRLSGHSVTLPPLRARNDRESVILRVFKSEAKRAGHAVCDIDPTAKRRMNSYSWPGNMRELQNVARYAMAVSSDGHVSRDGLPDKILAHETLMPQSRTSPMSVVDALAKAGGNITEAAKILGISRATVHRKIKLAEMKPRHQ